MNNNGVLVLYMDKKKLNKIPLDMLLNGKCSAYTYTLFTQGCYIRGSLGFGSVSCPKTFSNADYMEQGIESLTFRLVRVKPQTTQITTINHWKCLQLLLRLIIESVFGQFQLERNCKDDTDIIITI